MEKFMPKLVKFAMAVAVIVVAFYVYDWMQERKAKRIADETPVVPTGEEVIVG